MKLIVYSSNNKTKIISDFMAERIGAEEIEIKDLNVKTGLFNNLKNNFNALRSNDTKIVPKGVDLTPYNLILVGTPSTLGNPSPAIKTFIKNNDFKNKDVILYTTTNSTQGKNVLSQMKELIEEKDGKVINAFIVRVNKKTKEELIQNTLKVLYELDLDLYF